MKIWIYMGLGFGSLWLQLVLAPHLAVSGLRPNLMLITLVIIGLRWIDPWLFVYAALAGLGLDVFSHGLLGIYGLSFFAVSFLARYVGLAVYENSAWFSMAAVAGLTLAEGAIAITLFEVLTPQTPWWDWLFGKVIPLSLFHGLLAPIFNYGAARLERWTKIGETVGPRL